MITITVTNNEVTTQGHAKYAEEGKDIVCSAVSALVLTLGLWANAHAAQGETFVATDKGAAVVRFKAGNEIKREWRAVRDAIVDGLRQIAAKYPDNVIMIRI